MNWNSPLVQATLYFRRLPVWWFLKAFCLDRRSPTKPSSTAKLPQETKERRQRTSSTTMNTLESVRSHRRHLADVATSQLHLSGRWRSSTKESSTQLHKKRNSWGFSWAANAYQAMCFTWAYLLLPPHSQGTFFSLLAQTLGCCFDCHWWAMCTQPERRKTLDNWERAKQQNPCHLRPGLPWTDSDRCSQVVVVRANSWRELEK